MKEPAPRETTPPPSPKKKSQAVPLAQAAATAPCGSVSPWQSNYEVKKGDRLASAGHIWEALIDILGHGPGMLRI
ncbi:hypothetical protein GCM10023075_29070 [Streptosporangium album]